MLQLDFRWLKNLRYKCLGRFRLDVKLLTQVVHLLHGSVTVLRYPKEMQWMEQLLRQRLRPYFDSDNFVRHVVNLWWLRRVQNKGDDNTYTGVTYALRLIICQGPF